RNFSELLGNMIIIDFVMIDKSNYYALDTGNRCVWDLKFLCTKAYFTQCHLLDYSVRPGGLTLYGNTCFISDWENCQILSCSDGEGSPQIYWKDPDQDIYPQKLAWTSLGLVFTSTNYLFPITNPLSFSVDCPSE